MSQINRASTRLLMATAFAAVLSGCLHHPGGIAPSNVPINGRTYQVLGEVTGTDSAIRVFGVIPVTGSNTVREALDDAMRKQDADALINITVESYQHFWILFIRHITSVHGTAIKFD